MIEFLTFLLALKGDVASTNDYSPPLPKLPFFCRFECLAENKVKGRNKKNTAFSFGKGQNFLEISVALFKPFIKFTNSYAL